MHACMLIDAHARARAHTHTHTQAELEKLRRLEAGEDSEEEQDDAEESELSPTTILRRAKRTSSACQVSYSHIRICMYTQMHICIYTHIRVYFPPFCAVLSAPHLLANVM